MPVLLLKDRDKSIRAHGQYTQLKTIWMQLSK
jgi:hypothetical protein